MEGRGKTDGKGYIDNYNTHGCSQRINFTVNMFTILAGKVTQTATNSSSIKGSDLTTNIRLINSYSRRGSTSVVELFRSCTME